jgi:hypothetical protein
MDWLNLHTSTLDSAEFIGAEPTQRATWLCLQRYCIGQENGGRIVDCAEWTDRRWQQLCRVTRREVLSNCALWTWENTSLVVWSYPVEKEAEVIHKRNVARENGRSGGRPSKTTEPEPTLVLGPISYDKPMSVLSPKAEGKGKEGEGKGKEGNTPRKRGSKVVGYSLSEQPEDVRDRMLNINSLKNRQASTNWTAKEFAAFQAAGLDTAIEDDFHEQFSPVSKYYAAEAAELREFWRASDPRADFRRRDLLTLLNNWAGEVDRAREWCHWRQKKSDSANAGRL